MNDETDKQVIVEKLLTDEEMTDAIKVLMADGKNANVIREELKNSQLRVDQTLKLILADLEEPRPRFDRTSTRKLAVAAYEQARGFISVENLAEHSVIKDLSEELDKYVGQANIKFSHLRRQIEAIPSPDNMQELLIGNYTFKEWMKKVDDSEARIDNHTERLNIVVRELNKNLDSYNRAAHPTRLEFEALEMDYEELRIRHNDLVHFLKGAFANLGFYPVAKCIEEYKTKSQTESKDNEEPTTTS